ncbi:RNA recognition motif domain [Dillenia turbinata]|uniref:RNA recognition motif domain n=1 Tax=Dillenia turbinata TaxID=194707 RepID=A0AAN8V0T9_9MAGN
MAKKRKVRASTAAESSKAPESEPQTQQEERQQEVEQAQYEPIQEEVNPPQNDVVEEQQPETMDEEAEGEEAEGEEVEEEEEEEEEEEVEEDEEDNDNDEETLDPQNEKGASAEQQENGDEEEEDDGDSEEESVENLLEPFGKDQLVSLVKEAVQKYPDFASSIHKLADLDPAHRKIFVYGLGWDTTTETLTQVFGKYGEIEDCRAVTDKISGKSKGYGFILYRHRAGARKALKQPQKKIGNRMTTCQLASTGPAPAQTPAAPPVSEYTQRKIFVSNVSAEIDTQKLFKFFEKFGEIEEGPLGLDKATGKPKGFALFVYKSIEGAKKALEEPHKDFEGHTLHCQKAIDGPKPSKPFFQQQQHQHQHQQQYSSRKEKAGYMGNRGAGVSGPGHLMAPAGVAAAPAVGYNAPTLNPALGQALNPALGQALTALLTAPGGGLGLTNLLAGLGGPSTVPSVVSNAGHPVQGGYGAQAAGSYGNQPGMQVVYSNPQMGQPNPGRSQHGGAPYMGH